MTIPRTTRTLDMASLLTGAPVVVKSRAIGDAAYSLHELVDSLRRRGEVAADSQLPVDEHQVLAVEDFPEPGTPVRRGPRALLAGADLETLHDGRLDRLLRAGQERP